MTDNTLRGIRREFNTVIEALQRLEELGGSGQGHATDIAIVLKPLNGMLRGLMMALDPFVEMQRIEINRKWNLRPSTERGISCIRRTVEIGLEALEGIQETASDSVDGTAKAASRPMVTAIFQLEGGMNDLDALIERESGRENGGLVGPQLRLQ